MLATLLAIFYVFDINFPRLYKPALEMLDYFVFLSDSSNSNVKNSSTKKLSVAARNAIIEYEKNSEH